MSPSDVGGLISFIGIATQLGGALLLTAFFLLLRGHARRRAYFRAWSAAWLAMSVALAAVFSLYLLGWVAESGRARVVWFVYQLFKLLFASSLLAGALAYARGVRPARVQRVAVPASFVYAAITVLPASALNQVVAMQGPAVAAAVGVCAFVLLRLPASRASLGSRATGVFFALLSLLWAVYASLFGGGTEANAVTGFLLRHNSYVDLLVQMLLGYGMVVLLMEDAKREVDDAHAQLALAHDELKRVALYDSLTGALNRRAWSEGAGLDAARASYGAAVMLDLDNLKTVNDVHGHAAGDELLRRLCDVLRAVTRPSDRLYRWGGDEFLLVMPGARAADARRRLEEEVAAAGTHADGTDAPALQVSLGAADFRGGEELDSAVRHADAAMYDEKARRRGHRGALQPA